jgi:hypothetical protein
MPPMGPKRNTRANPPTKVARSGTESKEIDVEDEDVNIEGKNPQKKLKVAEDMSHMSTSQRMSVITNEYQNPNVELDTKIDSNKGKLDLGETLGSLDFSMGEVENWRTAVQNQNVGQRDAKERRTAVFTVFNQILLSNKDTDSMIDSQDSKNHSIRIATVVREVSTLLGMRRTNLEEWVRYFISEFRKIDGPYFGVGVVLNPTRVGRIPHLTETSQVPKWVVIESVAYLAQKKLEGIIVTYGTMSKHLKSDERISKFLTIESCPPITIDRKVLTRALRKIAGIKWGKVKMTGKTSGGDSEKEIRTQYRRWYYLKEHFENLVLEEQESHISA